MLLSKFDSNKYVARTPMTVHCYQHCELSKQYSLTKSNTSFVWLLLISFKLKEWIVVFQSKSNKWSNMSSYTETFNNREPPCVTLRDAAWSRTHRDLQATAMSIDYTGQWVLLAGRFDFSFISHIKWCFPSIRIKCVKMFENCFFIDDIWHCKNSNPIKRMTTISCENSIVILNMKLQLLNGQFQVNHKNTVL